MKMTVKTKLFCAGASVSILLCIILAITVFFFDNMGSGFQHIVDSSSDGVAKSQLSDATIGKVNGELTELTRRTNDISDAISLSNRSVQVTARKIKKLSLELNDITKTVDEVYGELPAGDAKDSLEIVADDIGDMQERMKREALIGLERSVKDLEQFTIDIAGISRKVMELTEELNNSKVLSSDVSKINTGIQQESLGFKSTISQNRNVLAVVILVFAGLSLVAGLIFARSITAPLISAVNFATVIAKGDFTKRLEVTSEDELGKLTVALNLMAANLSSMIKDVIEKITSLSISSSSMNDISHKMNSSADQTVGKAHTVAAAAEQMNSNMNSVSAAMEEASINVDSVTTSVNDISASIAGITTDLGGASKHAEEAVVMARDSAKTVTELGRAAEEVGQVTETIAAISDKTNLLALNATIEAARAGEAGKGFAVVANEIKSLASQTAEATTDIARKLKTIQLSSSTTVQVTGAITSAIEQVSELVADITVSMKLQNDATREIAENVSQASIGLKEIAENVSHASLASAQVAQEISEVNEASNEISNSGAMVGNTAEELSKLADELSLLMGKFQINT